MPEHSEGELRIVDSRIGSERTKNWRELYAGRKPVVVADGYHSSIDGEVFGVRINQENAERLCLCWNCHDDLLEACKEAREELFQLGEGAATAWQYEDAASATNAQQLADRIHAKLDAAIAKAEGRGM